MSPVESPALERSGVSPSRILQAQKVGMDSICGLKLAPSYQVSTRWWRPALVHRWCLAHVLVAVVVALVGLILGSLPQELLGKLRFIDQRQGPQFGGFAP